MGQVIKGDVADIIKKSFLELVAQADNDGLGVYEMPIEVSNQMAKWLQLDNPKEKISIARLKNGIMGYCPLNNGNGNAFTFVANCEEFNAKRPNSVEKSELQLYKMNYSNDSNQRIFVDLGDMPNQPVRCRYKTPPILPNQNTVQQVLNLIEYAMRNATLENMACHDYPEFCLQEHLENLKNGNKSQDEVMQEASAVLRQTINNAPYMNGNPQFQHPAVISQPQVFSSPLNGDFKNRRQKRMVLGTESWDVPVLIGGR